MNMVMTKMMNMVKTTTMVKAKMTITIWSLSAPQCSSCAQHLDLKIKYSMFCVRFDKNAAQRKIHFCAKTWRGILAWNVRFLGGGKTIPILFQYFLLAKLLNILYIECLLLVIIMIKKQDHQNRGITKDFW